MATRINRSMLTAAVVVSGIAIVLYFDFRVAHSPEEPGVVFVGLTNNTSGLIAEFRITNSAGWRGCLNGNPIQVESRSSWRPSVVLPGVAPELPRCCVTNVFVTVPSDYKDWRLQVLFVRESSSLEKWLRAVTKPTGWQMPEWHSDNARYFAVGVPNSEP